LAFTHPSDRTRKSFETPPPAWAQNF
jgi:hypothetical protein